jgi:5-enolpyruvylshikimate-3-phosphate synthase
LEVVKALASLGADVTVSDNDGTTPVWIAAREGHLEVVKALHSLGADVTVPNNDGATPLHAGAGRPSAAVCAFLLASGADAQARDGKGRTPADVAMDVRDREVSVLFDPAASVVAVTGRPCLKCEAPTHLCLWSGHSCDSCGEGDIAELHFACRPCNIDFCANCAGPPA